MATSILVVCPRNATDTFSSMQFPVDWHITYSETVDVKECLSHELSLIFIDSLPAYQTVAPTLPELYSMAPHQIVLILDQGMQSEAGPVNAPVTDIWTWPVPEQLFISNITRALQRSNKYAELSRQRGILDKQKQLFLKQKAKLEHIIKSIPFGILMVDTDNQIIVMNKQAKKIIGVDLNDDVLTSDYLREKIAYYPFDLVRGIRDKGGEVLEEELTMLSGKFHSKIVLVKDYSNEILGTLIIFLPLFEGESFRDQAVDLINTVLHEIKTPVTSIITSLEIINKEISDKLDARHRRILSLGYQNCERLLQLSKDFLDVSMIESGLQNLDIQELPIFEFIDEIIKTFSYSASEKEMTIESSTSSSVEVVLADPAHLRQVFNNLLSNAIKFSSPRQRITISCDDDPFSSNFVRINIHNVGPPIPAEDHKKIFDRFFRSVQSIHQDRIGSGLGLHITKSMINSMGGKIWVESDAARGTSFFFTLPGVELEQ